MELEVELVVGLVEVEDPEVPEAPEAPALPDELHERASKNYGSALCPAIKLHSKQIVPPLAADGSARNEDQTLDHADQLVRRAD